jgi:hypothetical protein
LHLTELGAPPRDYETAFRTLRAGDPQALLFLMSGTFFRDREKLAALAREHRLQDSADRAPAR